jgi:hypothetical protein
VGRHPFPHEGVEFLPDSHREAEGGRIGFDVPYPWSDFSYVPNCPEIRECSVGLCSKRHRSDGGGPFVSDLDTRQFVENPAAPIGSEDVADDLFTHEELPFPPLACTAGVAGSTGSVHLRRREGVKAFEPLPRYGQS